MHYTDRDALEKEIQNYKRKYIHEESKSNLKWIIFAILNNSIFVVASSTNTTTFHWFWVRSHLKKFKKYIYRHYLQTSEYHTRDKFRITMINTSLNLIKKHFYSLEAHEISQFNSTRFPSLNSIKRSSCPQDRKARDWIYLKKSPSYLCRFFESWHFRGDLKGS